jgi:NAD(P)-dependent dehydrogenase (short-subunit alcohol dehydrogenase family)
MNSRKVTDRQSQRVLITGVSRGLGRAMAERFIELGHTVWGCARSPVAIEELQKQFDRPHQFAVVDVSDDRQVRDWSRELLTEKIAPDLLINNAGVINRPAALWELDDREFSQTIDVNVKGVANTIRHFVPSMVANDRGIIVNFSSGWGRSTSPQVGPYCATKWAIEGLTRSLAQELPTTMGAIALNPGIIHTEMLEICFGESAASYTPIARWVDRAVPFLLDLSPRNNGAALTVGV